MVPRQTVEQSLILDIAAWRRWGALDPAARRGGYQRWSDPASGEELGFLNFTVSANSRFSEPRAVIDYLASWIRAAARQELALTSTAPPLGGSRWWFTCPCGRRSGKLYLPFGGESFACRICHELAYQSRRNDRPTRLAQRADKLWERIGCKRGVEPRVRTKPKGMRRATYWRLRHAAAAFDDEATSLALARALR